MLKFHVNGWKINWMAFCHSTPAWIEYGKCLKCSTIGVGVKMEIWTWFCHLETRKELKFNSNPNFTPLNNFETTRRIFLDLSIQQSTISIVHKKKTFLILLQVLKLSDQILKCFRVCYFQRKTESLPYQSWHMKTWNSKRPDWVNVEIKI